MRERERERERKREKRESITMQKELKLNEITDKHFS